MFSRIQALVNLAAGCVVVYVLAWHRAGSLGERREVVCGPFVWPSLLLRLFCVALFVPLPNVETAPGVVQEDWCAQC